MKTTLLTLILIASPAIAAEDAAPAPPPMTQAELEAVIDRVAERCRDHLDVRAYVDVANDRATERVTPAVIASLRSFYQTGHLDLRPEITSGPVGQNCVTFTEGLLAGEIGHALFDGFVKGIAQAITAMVEGLAEAFGAKTSPATPPN